MNALNKMDPEAIVYIDSRGTLIRLTVENFASPEEFQRWKEWSDSNYRSTDIADALFSKRILSLHCLSEKVLHIHVLLVAPLRAGYMAQPGTDQHEGGVAIRERAHHPSAAADFPVKPFYDIIGTDTRPVFAGKIAVGKRLFNAIFYLPGGLFQFHGTQFLHNRFCLLPCSLFALLSMDRLEHLGHQLYLGTRRYREHVAVKVDSAALVFGFREQALLESLQRRKNLELYSSFFP